MKRLLYILRSNPDLERVVPLAMACKDRFEQHFVCAGDDYPLFSHLNNEFQKILLINSGFRIRNISDFHWFTRILSLFALKKNVPMSDCHLWRHPNLFARVFSVLLETFVPRLRVKLVENCFGEINPDAVLTDFTSQDMENIPHLLRLKAIEHGRRAFIFSHGAAHSLQHAWFKGKSAAFPNCYHFASNEDELTMQEEGTGMVTGDPREDLSYNQYLQKLDLLRFSFLDEKKHRIVFLLSGTIPYSTNGWDRMKELAMDWMERDDVAIVIKPHPREGVYPNDQLAFLGRPDVLLLKESVDTSRLIQWATIIVNGDHCSTVFEAIQSGKKVLVMRGKRWPRFEGERSPLEGTSVVYLNGPEVNLNLDTLPLAQPDDPILNTCCWGGYGPASIPQRIVDKVDELLGGSI